MPKESVPKLAMRPPHRLLLIFASTILVPGILLAFFGLRALVQESRLVDQQIRERLQGAGQTAARRLERELSEWQQAIDQLGQSGATDPALWPARVRLATQEPGSAVVLLGEKDRVQAFPAGQLPYILSPAPAASSPVGPRPPFWPQAELAELREKNYEKAIRLYRRLLGSAKRAERVILLHRVARCLRKADRQQEALRAFHVLKKEPSTPVGLLPSDLLALYEISVLEQELGDSAKQSEAPLQLYRDLVGGRWALEKSSYAFYSDRIREIVAPSEEVARLEQTERTKLALAHAAERFLLNPRSLLAEQGRTCLAVWQSEPFAATLLAEPFLRTRVWPAAFNGTEDPDLQFSLLAPGGQVLFGVPAPNQQPFATQTIQSADLLLRLQIRPRDTAALYAGLDRRRNFYFGMLGVVITLLVFGGYLTVRTVKTELAMAQSKSEFVSTVSHEFRSPLTGIHQLAEMLKDGRVKDEQRRQRYYEMIVSESRRLRRLVENVLDFSRIEEGRKKYDLEPFEPTPWLREQVEEFQAEVSGTGVTIAASIPDGLPLVLGDREALSTALHNLLDNAVKYSPDSNTVWIETMTNGHSLSIAVRDRGVGIRDEEKEHIFERFYRGGELLRQVKGVGLGLILVKSIVTAHEGSVDFDSRPGEGSTFTIHLRVGS